MELAHDWKIERVLEALQNKQRLELTQFIEKRYETRFFDPISLLEEEAVRNVPCSKGKHDPNVHVRPFGFAIMSLACLLIETLESYRRGIPTTSKEDFKKIISDSNYQQRPKPAKCTEAEIPGTREAFKSFFKLNGEEFSGLDGEKFYENVRNALLHQSQTRNGWKLNIHQVDEAATKTNEVWIGIDKILYRDSFVSKLHSCFGAFVADLRANLHEDGKWKNPERKIWWIAWLSDCDCVVEWLKAHPFEQSHRE